MAQEKQVTIVVAGSNGEAKDLALAPGGTVREALDEAGLQGYTLSYKGKPLNPEDDLYALVGNGDKVHATLSEMAVGMGGFASLYGIPDVITHIKEFIARNFRHRLRKKHSHGIIRVRLIRSRRTRCSGKTKRARVTRTYRRKAAKVIRVSKEKEYWQERGWKRKGDRYEGCFRTESGEWHGLVREACSGMFEAFIFKPPAFLKEGEHGDCFLYKGKEWYEVHFSKIPKDASSAILAVEKVIHASFEEIGKGE